MSKCVYDGQCPGNILVVGQTGYSKIIFVQKLATRNMFGKLKEVKWISETKLSKEKENKYKPLF